MSAFFFSTTNICTCVCTCECFSFVLSCLAGVMAYAAWHIHLNPPDEAPVPDFVPPPVPVVIPTTPSPPPEPEEPEPEVVEPEPEVVEPEPEPDSEPETEPESPPPPSVPIEVNAIPPVVIIQRQPKPKNLVRMCKNWRIRALQTIVVSVLHVSVVL